MRTRAEEYLEAQRLADLAVKTITDPQLPPLGDRALTAQPYLRAALVSATNAAADPGIDHEVRALVNRPKPSPPGVRT